MHESLEKVIDAVVSANLHQMFTAMPAQVLRVDLTRGSVDVQPLLKARYKTGDVRTRPAILNVPLMLPASGTSIVNIPVAEGDIVLCVFSMRGLDTFKDGDGSLVTPTDFRIFDKRDAIAIPGLFPFSEHPNKKVASFDPTALSITHNVGTPLEATVSIDAAGQINLNSPLKVSITAPVVSINGV